MNEGYRSVQVYVRDNFAGVLSETDYGYMFKYDEHYLQLNYATPVSLTLPLRKEEYKSKTLFAFFDGLIPEGWLLNITLKNWKLNAKDRFGVLMVACKDSIGNVSVLSTRCQE